MNMQQNSHSARQNLKNSKPGKEGAYTLKTYKKLFPPLGTIHMFQSNFVN
uniref:40S ribosomal protein S20-2-like n=1 Tax=Rhizophora mucronata TaxID=61149 RepID=A0A2P2IZ41_RHIMU